MTAISNMDMIEEVIDIKINKIEESIDKFTKQGLGWIIEGVSEFQITFAKYQPLKGSSYIPLPKFVQYSTYNLKNIQNTDQECFKQCIARSDCLNRSHNEKVSREVKKHAEKYNWTGIKFPISIRQIDRFEKQNNTSVDVYVNEGVSFYPL